MEKSINFKKFNMFYISQSRKFLMGISALWIMLYHSEIAFSRVDNGGFFHFLYILDYHVYLIKSLGQTGVDIFLFLSAIGLFFSLNKEEDLLSFYKKRIIRILPTFLVFGLIYELLTFVSLKESILYLSGLNFILYGKRRYWYVFLAVLTYAIYPFLHRLEKNKGRWIYLFFICLSVLFNWFLSICFPSLFNNIEIALRRIPVFLFGCFCAKDVKNQKEYNAFILLFFLIVFLSSYLYLVGQEYNITVFYRYVNSLFAFSFIILVSYLYVCLSDTFILKKIALLIEKCGNYSLEFYIGFDIALLLVKRITQSEKTISVALLSFVLCLIMCYVIKKCLIDKMVIGRKI